MEIQLNLIMMNSGILNRQLWYCNRNKVKPFYNKPSYIGLLTMLLKQEYNETLLE